MVTYIKHTFKFLWITKQQSNWYRTVGTLVYIAHLKHGTPHWSHVVLKEPHATLISDSCHASKLWNLKFTYNIYSSMNRFIDNEFDFYCCYFWLNRFIRIVVVNMLNGKVLVTSYLLTFSEYYVMRSLLQTLK